MPRTAALGTKPRNRYASRNCRRLNLAMRSSKQVCVQVGSENQPVNQGPNPLSHSTHSIWRRPTFSFQGAGFWSDRPSLRRTSGSSCA
jgi:hypothetical protein